MKIREVEPQPRRDRPAEPIIPNVRQMFDQNLMRGMQIEDNDIQEMQDRFAHQARGIPSPNTTIDDANEGWQRQEVPSLGVPYGISTNSIWVRPLDVPMLAQVHAAQMEGQRGNNFKALTMFIDALSPTIREMDIRDLTVPDWHSHLYWLRLNSYPRSPFTVPWISRYGNENISRVTSSHFEFEELAMTREEFLKWRKKGITFPTLRDMEMLTNPEMNDATRWTITYAQYVYIEGPVTPDLMKRKIDALNKGGPDLIADINEFGALMSHGVVEQISVRDEKFEINAAIEYIENEIEQLTTALNAALDKSDESGEAMGRLFNIGMRVTERGEEVKKLKAVRENGGLDSQGKRFVPELEVVPLAKPDATILFP
ncbi:hypothetical protein EVB87_128 [Rhizobium phage RHph_N28_1]|nr:hypothetical protein EVB87_128 [Rhizobium phage RHph_N28_1]QIG74157.1 hypothetical protein EVC07_129 [Rhizobium phage RHph_N42]QXV73815.1 hypothetical protein [Rhizobium phage RHph_N46]